LQSGSSYTDDILTLRQKAEQRLTKLQIDSPVSNADAHKLLHELQVHQIELEMQNEELKEANRQVLAGIERYTDFYDFSPTGFVSLNEKGEIKQINLAGARLLQVERARLTNRRFVVFLLQKDVLNFNELLKRVFESEDKQSCEVMLQVDKQPPSVIYIEACFSAAGQECRASLLDISKLKATEESLINSREAAETANHAKSNFLANMGHEIRTPMNSIIGLSDLALKANPSTKMTDYLNTIQTSGMSLVRIINDILDAAKIEAGKLHI
jgi:signal transduction histidine kinase